jgi:hypothetical protein
MLICFGSTLKNKQAEHNNIFPVQDFLISLSPVSINKLSKTTSCLGLQGNVSELRSHLKRDVFNNHGNEVKRKDQIILR